MEKMDGMNFNDFIQQTMDSVENEFKSLTKLNVMVLGKTGVGKSTLINNLFSEKMADTGVGKPVTDQIKKLEKPGFPLALYDTPGLELDGNFSIDKLKDEIKTEIQKGFDSGEIAQAIHCILYCISTTSHRFEQAEICFLKEFTAITKTFNVPVIIVLTQSYSKNDANELKSVIDKENLNIKGIVPIVAENLVLDDEEHPIKSYGLDTLTEFMNNVLPEEIQKTFIAVQCANLELKKQKAHTAVKVAVGSAAVAGASPIPFSDAAILIPIQIVMIAKITAIFGIPLQKATITAIASSTLGTAGATILGKTAVTTILKFIPGVGSVVGGAISGSTAAAITAALGNAYIAIVTMVAKGSLKVSDLATDIGKEALANAFKEQLKAKRNAEGEQI